MRSPTPQILVPSALLIFGICALSGCVIVPTYGLRVGGRNVSEMVGEADSKKPIRVGRATRTDVLRLLGTPQYVGDDGLKFGYSWSNIDAVVLGLCSGIPRTDHVVVVRFDADGILTTFDALDHDFSFRASPGFHDYPGPPIPQELHATPSNWTPPPLPQRVREPQS